MSPAVLCPTLTPHSAPTTARQLVVIFALDHKQQTQVATQHAKMSSSTKVFSLEGKGLKLDTAADVEPHIAPLREMAEVEEVKLLGNTLGVEACKAIGEVLQTKKTLQVGDPRSRISCRTYIL